MTLKNAASSKISAIKFLWNNIVYCVKIRYIVFVYCMLKFNFKSVLGI